MVIFAKEFYKLNSFLMVAKSKGKTWQILSKFSFKLKDSHTHYQLNLISLSEEI